MAFKKRRSGKGKKNFSKEYNLDKGLTAHKRLMMKHRNIRKSTDDPDTYFSSLEKEIYHGDCVDYMSSRLRKLSKDEKSEIFKTASYKARSN